MKSKYFFVVGVVVFLFSLFVIGQFRSEPSYNNVLRDPSLSSNVGESKWRNLSLVNVVDDSSFTINDLSDKPVLLESFAVWCPSCTRQQRQVEELKDSEFGGLFYSVSLNTDTNEDASVVRDHISKNGFTGVYAIAGEEYTNALIDEFSFAIVNAPSMPIVLVCQNNSGNHFLPSGLKTSEELRQSIESKCGVSV